MSKIFIDFETDGLDGKVTEFAALDEFGNVLKTKKVKTKEEFQNLMNDIIKWNGEENIIIFWHNFMSTYLIKYYSDIYNDLQGRYVTFVDAYSIINNSNKTRYSIAKITEDLLNHEHQGNALQDAKDLLDCFNAIRKRYSLDQ